LEGQVGALTEKVAELARLAFGKSSEKTSARQTAEQTAGEGGPDGAGAGQQAGDLVLIANLREEDRDAAV
jgi:hypothetical protein